jgi:hypothetical protein
MRSGVNIVYKDTLQVHAGDVVTIEPENASIAGTMAYCSIKHIPPLLIDTNLNWPTMPDGAAVPIMRPDDARKETVNRITTGAWKQNESGSWVYNSAEWTADRTGYVEACLDFQLPVEGYGSVAFYRNDIPLWRVGANTNVYGSRYTFEVTKGDVVKLSANTYAKGEDVPRNMYCYFIPPKYINKELPVIVEKNGSYSLEEVKTSEKDEDGNDIYKRTWIVAGPTSAGSGIEFQTGEDITPIRHETRATGLSGNRLCGNITYTSEGMMRFVVRPYWHSAEKQMRIVVWVAAGATDQVGINFRVTVYYTKNTD